MHPEIGRSGVKSWRFCPNLAVLLCHQGGCTPKLVFLGGIQEDCPPPPPKHDHVPGIAPHHHLPPSWALLILGFRPPPSPQPRRAAPRCPKLAGRTSTSTASASSLTPTSSSSNASQLPNQVWASPGGGYGGTRWGHPDLVDHGDVFVCVPPPPPPQKSVPSAPQMWCSSSTARAASTTMTFRR